MKKKIEEEIRNGIISKLSKHSATFWSANTLKVTVGTNTPCGGDSGHGGQTVFELEDEGGTAWTLKFTKDGKETSVIIPQKIKIELGGDTEADTFIECLRFAHQILEMQNKRTKAFTLSSEK